MVKDASSSSAPLFSSTMIIVVMVGVLLSGAAATYLVVQHAKTAEVGSDASHSLVASVSSPYTDLSGKPFTFDTYRNKLRIVNLWASWSPYTATEFPELEKLGAKYADKGVVVLAVDRGEQRERAAAYLKQLGTFPHIIPVIDETDAYYKSIGGYAMPETIVYDTTGKEILHVRGVINVDTLESVIKQHLPS